MNNLSTFRPKGDRAQAKITLELYKYFLKTQGQPEAAVLLNYQHCFFHTLLKVDGLDSTKIACVTEQAVFLSSLTPDGWLLADNTDYFTLFNKGKDHANNDTDLIGPQAVLMNTSNTSEDGIWGLENDDPVTDNEDDNEYHSEEEEEDPTEAIVETGMETGAQEKINKADGHMEQSGNEQDLDFMRYSRAEVNISKDVNSEKESVIQLLNNERQWTVNSSSSGVATAYYRNCIIWHQVSDSLSKDDPPPPAIKVWQKGHIMNITDNTNHSYDVDLCLVGLLPSMETGISLEKFPLHEIHDNYSRAAIYQQEHNSTWLTPMCHAPCALLQLPIPLAWELEFKVQTMHGFEHTNNIQVVKMQSTFPGGVFDMIINQLGILKDMKLSLLSDRDWLPAPGFVKVGFNVVKIISSDLWISPPQASWCSSSWIFSCLPL
ncbi:hypothetical protein FIBSPDRAFT_900477 [Athelia psychrophila]|uniref:Uncharacterized protein n=1 Tax=Athelia psychrophila TaxID=1759441 RepID=A0A165YE04_9AGAM|nr:hypothetical protein FIBSPDRAFT_900477 [Fibularhizoctonia sp. CBS 109695]